MIKVGSFVEVAIHRGLHTEELDAAHKIKRGELRVCILMTDSYDLED